MADSPSSAQAPGSNPWFVSGDPSAQGLSTTAQQAVTNQQVNGLAQDLTKNTQGALNAIIAALNALPSHP